MVVRNRSKHATQGSIFARSSTEKSVDLNPYYEQNKLVQHPKLFAPYWRLRYTKFGGAVQVFFSLCKLSFRHDVQHNISDKLREV